MEAFKEVFDGLTHIEIDKVGTTETTINTYLFID